MLVILCHFTCCSPAVCDPCLTFAVFKNTGDSSSLGVALKALSAAITKTTDRVGDVAGSIDDDLYNTLLDCNDAVINAIKELVLYIRKAGQSAPGSLHF